MATVSHGILDAVDQMLELASGLERQLVEYKARSTTEVKTEAASLARDHLDRIKHDLSALRQNVEVVRRP